MPPYTYESFSNRPYVGTIADLLQEPGRAQARAAEIGGAAKAQALMQTGQGISGAVQQYFDPAMQDRRALDQAYSGGLDRQSILDKLPGHLKPIVQRQFAEADEAALKVQKLRDETAVAERDYFGSLAAGVQPFLKGPDGGQAAVMVALQHAKERGYGPHADQLWAQIQHDPTHLPDLVETLIAQSPKQVELRTAAKTADARAASAAKPTEATLAVGAASGDPTAQAALDKLKPPKTPPSIEEQLLEAVTKGDKPTVDRITNTMQMAARAKKDPAAEALAQQLKNLSAQEAEERLKKLREENAPVDVSQSTFTTQSGRQYVDLSEFQTPSAREKARKAAMDAGVMPVNKEVADGLRAADTARANFQALWAQLAPFLAKDAAGRLVQGPVNKLEKVFQSNPTLGAIGSWRTAAIQAVQALAEKGMGLRLNRAEIDLMLQNDIPQITDDAPTARQRIDNILTLLDNKEKDALERDRSQFAPKPPTTPPIKLTPGLKRLSER